jgi:hypothetical protein
MFLPPPWEEEIEGMDGDLIKVFEVREKGTKE